MNRMGHTLSGVAAGVWSLPVAPISGAAGIVVWVAAVTGFALAPDLDHPKATAANMWGPVTRAPSAFLTHRGFTHRPAGVAAAVVTAWAAVTGALAPLVAAVAAVFGHAHPGQFGHTVGAWALLAVLAVTAGLALAAARVPWPLNLPASWAAAAATVWVGFPLAWLPWAVALAEELVQTAAVAVNFLGAIERRTTPRRRVYLSGPIAGVPDFRDRFAAAGEAARAKLGDVEIIDPCDVAVLSHDGVSCAPGYSAGEDAGHSSACFMRTDLIALLTCDEIWMLPDHGRSRGATVELAVARACGMVVHSPYEQGQNR